MVEESYLESKRSLFRTGALAWRQVHPSLEISTKRARQFEPSDGGKKPRPDVDT